MLHQPRTTRLITLLPKPPNPTLRPSRTSPISDQTKRGDTFYNYITDGKKGFINWNKITISGKGSKKGRKKEWTKERKKERNVITKQWSPNEGRQPKFH